MEDYGLVLSEETERRFAEMCNLSEVLIEQGELAGKITARYEDGMSIEQIAEKSNVDVEVVTNILKEKGLLQVTMQ